MITKLVELTNGLNWGKFLVCRFDRAEWARKSALPGEIPIPLLTNCGWGEEHLIVFDLATGEGARFRPGGYVKADLDKHAIWVCPMFEPFLEWLYRHPAGWTDFDALPDVIMLSEEETRGHGSMYGYRRPGPKAAP